MACKIVCQSKVKYIMLVITMECDKMQKMEVI